MLSLAITLAGESEPLTNIYPKSAARLLQLLKDYGLCLLITDHRADPWLFMADAVRRWTAPGGLKQLP
jgi:ABC-type lipopolysaccharide export system ATPase subunit